MLCDLFGVADERCKLYLAGNKVKIADVGEFITERWVDDIDKVDEVSESKTIVDSVPSDILDKYMYICLHW